MVARKYRNKKTGTVYAAILDNHHPDYWRVLTKAGAKYIVKSMNLEQLKEGS